jgi:hypothetical protein
MIVCSLDQDLSVFVLLLKQALVFGNVSPVDVVHTPIVLGFLGYRMTSHTSNPTHTMGKVTMLHSVLPIIITHVTTHDTIASNMVIT